MADTDKIINQRERIKFIEKWADYVRTHSDREWSRQQKVLIDSQIKSARKQMISVKDYLEIKEKIRNGLKTKKMKRLLVSNRKT